LVGEEFEESKFMRALSESQRKVVRVILFSSASFGGLMLVMLGLYSLGFYYGKWLIIWEIGDSEKILSTFFCFVIGGASVSQMTPILKNIAEAKVAAASLFRLMERSKTLVEPANGAVINDIESISFRDVTFRYSKLGDEEENAVMSKIVPIDEEAESPEYAKVETEEKVDPTP
jgi:ATP-binding cassette subfamily B (MDR/TAP) protein 1